MEKAHFMQFSTILSLMFFCKYKKKAHIEYAEEQLEEQQVCNVFYCKVQM